MRTRERDIEEKVGQWVAFADEDLKAARQILRLSSACPYRIAAYHAQQCAEKYLKAFLVSKGQDFPYTHDIGRLLELCLPYGSWPKTVLVAAELTTHATAARYPGEEAKVSKKEALRAIGLASLVKKAVRGILKENRLIL